MPASPWNNLKARVQVTGKNNDLLKEINNHPLVDCFFLGKMADKFRDNTGDTAEERDKITLQKMLDHMNLISKGMF